MILVPLLGDTQESKQTTPGYDRIALLSPEWATHAPVLVSPLWGTAVG